MEDMNKESGNREFYDVEESEKIEPFLDLILEQARDKVSLPLKKNTRNQQILYLCWLQE
jgi:hypothetical protein